jgi:acyl-CoA thioesterase
MYKSTAINNGIDAELFRKILDRLHNMPACQTMGISIEYLGQGTAGLKMTVSKELVNSQGALHGGLIAALADTAMGYSIFTLNCIIVTLDLNINYLAPALMGTELTAEAYVLHAGKNTIVSEATLHNSNNTLVAKSRGTFFISINETVL